RRARAAARRGSHRARGNRADRRRHGADRQLAQIGDQKMSTRVLQLALAAALGSSLALNVSLVLIDRAARKDESEAFGRTVAYGCGFVAGELAAAHGLGIPIRWPEGLCDGERVNAVHHGFAADLDPEL